MAEEVAIKPTDTKEEVITKMVQYLSSHDKQFMEERQKRIGQWCDSFVAAHREISESETHQFVNRVNDALAPSIRVFQARFYHIWQTIKAHVLEQNKYKCESNIHIENYPTASLDWLGHWNFHYEDSLLGTTKVRIKKHNEIGEIESSKITFCISLGDKLKTVIDGKEYEIICFDDSSGVKVQINGFEYVNNRCTAFGSGFFSDCRRDELYLHVASRNCSSEMDDFFQKNGYRKEYFGGGWYIPYDKDKEQLMQEVATHYGIEPVLSWRKVMDIMTLHVQTLLHTSSVTE